MELDFYNHNAGIAYPLLDAPGGHRVGALQWSHDTFLDCGFVVVDREAGAATLQQISRDGDNLVYRFSLNGLAADVAVPLDAQPGTVARAAGAAWDGFIVTGPGHNALATLHDGTRHAVLPAPVVEPGCLQWLQDAYVTGIRLANRGARDVVVLRGGVVATLTGDVEFVPGMNAAIATRQDGRLEIEDDLDGGTVERPMLPDGFADCGGFIRTINGIGPDAGGNFSIIGGSGVEVRDFPDEHRIEIDFTKGLSDKACIV